MDSGNLGPGRSARGVGKGAGHAGGTGRRGSGSRIRSSRLGTSLTYLVLGIVSAGSVYPLFLMINESFRSDNDIATNPSGLAVRPTLSSYHEMIDKGALRAFGNSVLVSVLVTIGSVFFCALAAYALTKLRFRGRNAVFVILLTTIMVPVQTSIPGFFAYFADLGWINSYRIQILPFVTPVFGLFMIRQYLLSVPDSLIEAGRMDGASEFRIFWQLVVPVIRPILAAFGVLQFLSTWNSYIWPQVMANSPDVAPLSVVLPTMRDNTLGLTPLLGAMMAGSILMTVPLILLFLKNQSAFMQGVSYSAK
jgi:ABC-type glycerol-3-phosphate transport system permease component